MWSDAADGLYVFGGNGSAGLNDLWLYDREANSWQQLAVSGAPPVRSGHGMVWCHAVDGFFLFGGEDTGRGPGAAWAVRLRPLQ